MMTKTDGAPAAAEVILDARGHRCPVPTLKLRKQLLLVEPGTIVILLADDPMAQIDVPHFCNQNSYLLESLEALDNHWVFRVRKPARDAIV